MKKLVLICAATVLGLFAIAGSAHAGAGVGATWYYGSIIPDITIPIKMESGMIIEPRLGFTNISYDEGSSSQAAGSVYSYGGTAIRLGVSGEFPFGEATAAHPMIGACVGVQNISPDVEGLDSWTDFFVDAFVGGTASLTDGCDAGVRAGVELWMYGEQKAGDVVVEPSATEIATFVQFFMRWWLWGQ
ncbi:MAG TPA: hypothetical protein VGB22_05345 [candidate division Zixibacteria bacterium]|jgi:hypothetical protein